MLTRSVFAGAPGSDLLPQAPAAISETIRRLRAKWVTPRSIRQAPPGSRSSVDVRRDQVFRPGGLLAIGEHGLARQRLLERDVAGVVAGKCRLELAGDPGAQPTDGLAAGLLEERREQPAADAPRHAVVAAQQGRAAV